MTHPPTPEATVARLLAHCQSALDAAERNLSIARALASGFVSHVQPPEVVLEAYLACFEGDEAQLKDLRQRVEQLKNAMTLGAGSET